MPKVGPERLGSARAPVAVVRFRGRRFVFFGQIGEFRLVQFQQDRIHARLSTEVESGKGLTRDDSGNGKGKMNNGKERKAMENGEGRNTMEN